MIHEAGEAVTAAQRIQALATSFFRACIVAGVIAILLSSRATAKTHYCFGKKATIVGTSGHDILTGTNGPDVIVGLDGGDSLDGRGGNDRLCSGKGGIYSADTAIESISGGRGRDLLSGGRGQDYLVGGKGRDAIKGGPGWDQIRDGSSWSKDRMFGGEGHDFILGEGGDDLLQGGKGVDGLFGGKGDDDIRGGANGREGYYGPFQGRYGNGGDWLEVSLFRKPLHVNLTRGVVKGNGVDTIRGVENVDGPDAPSTIIGDERANILVAGTRNDTLRGRGGDDCMDVHQGGNDRLYGGSGFDYYAGHPLDLCQVLDPDLVYPGPGTKGDVVNLSTGEAIPRHGDSVSLSSIEGAFGTNGQDELIGNHKANSLYGQVGSDVLDGKGGDDYLDGGPAMDAADGGPDDDECVNVEAPVNCEH